MIAPRARTDSRRDRAARCAGLLLCGAMLLMGCSGVKGTEDARPLDYFSVKQCDRGMTALDGRVRDMEALLTNGAPSIEVLEAVQRLRGDIVPLHAQCTGSSTATKKLKKLDKDLEALAQRLETESYR
jgi:hypothetical protein